MQKLRDDCWCSQQRKPCSYHEGMDDAYNDILRLIATQASMLEVGQYLISEIGPPTGQLAQQDPIRSEPDHHHQPAQPDGQ